MKSSEATQPLKKGDVILINPSMMISLYPEHFGEFDHFNKAGLLVYRNAGSIKTAPWKAVVRIIHK